MDVLFYKNLKEFLKELNSVFPDDDEMKVITSSINIYSMDDSEYKIIKKFYASIAPLEDIVLSRDEKFFYMDHSKYWKKDILQLFNKLNFYWDNIGEHNKKIVWDYIIVIYNLSKEFALK